MRNFMLKIKAIRLFMFTLTAVALVVGTASCNMDHASKKPADVDYYTCTMHPSVKSQDPDAKCPICGMDLVPVMKRGAAGTNGTNVAMPEMGGEEKPGEFNVPVKRQQQIGVTYAAIGKRSFTNIVRAVGMVAYDKQRHWDYVARVEGYVQATICFFARRTCGKRRGAAFNLQPGLAGHAERIRGFAQIAGRSPGQRRH